MKRTVWLVAASVTLWSLIPAGQQKVSQPSIAQAQDLVNADRHSELGVVRVRNLTAYTHEDNANRRKIVERMGFALLPQFVAEGDVFKGDRYFGSKRTGLYDDDVAVFDDWTEFSFGFRNALPIDDSERAKLQKELNRFVANALEISRGPGRWSRYVPVRVRDLAIASTLATPDQNSDAGLLKAITAWLDSSPFYLWSALEQPATFLRLLDELVEVPALDELLNRYRPQLVRALNGRTASHLQRDASFLSQVLLGEVWRVRNGDAEDLQVASLPKSQYIYCAQYGVSLILVFEWADDALRLVNIAAIRP